MEKCSVKLRLSGRLSRREMLQEDVVVYYRIETSWLFQGVLATAIHMGRKGVNGCWLRLGAKCVPWEERKVGATLKTLCDPQGLRAVPQKSWLRGRLLKGCEPRIGHQSRSRGSKEASKRWSWRQIGSGVVSQDSRLQDLLSRRFDPQIDRQSRSQGSRKALFRVGIELGGIGFRQHSRKDLLLKESGLQIDH